MNRFDTPAKKRWFDKTRAARHRSCAMKRFRAVGCVLLILSIPVVPVLGQDVDLEKAEVVRTGMTLAGAAAGLAAGASIGIGFSLDAIDTPLSNTLLLTIPVAAAGATAGALAGRWIADVALRHQPSPLFAVIEGAGLGLVGGAFVGGIVFPLNFVIAYRLLEVPEGYWGRFDYPQTLGLAVLAGAFWGGFFGLLGGTVAVPLISLYMGF
jgi:hypothetical protein